MNAYDAEPWHDFAVATGGASAALVGLLFVAISINLRLIVSLPRPPERALHALVLLVAPLLLSLALLVPQSGTALGVEMLVVGAATGPVLAALVRPARRPPESPRGCSWSRSCADSEDAWASPAAVVLTVEWRLEPVDAPAPAGSDVAGRAGGGSNGAGARRIGLAGPHRRRPSWERPQHPAYRVDPLRGRRRRTGER